MWGVTSTGGTNTNVHFGHQQIGSTFIYEIKRLTGDTTEFAVYNAQNFLLDSATRNTSDITTNNLFVSLFASGASTTVNWVSVVPEPTAGMLLTLAASGLITRRSRRVL